jgi:hypothetical protein
MEWTSDDRHKRRLSNPQLSLAEEARLHVEAAERLLREARAGACGSTGENRAQQPLREQQVAEPPESTRFLGRLWRSWRSWHRRGSGQCNEEKKSDDHDYGAN